MAFLLISIVVLDLLDQVQIFWQSCVMQLLELLTGLGLFELYQLIYLRLLAVSDMLVFTNLILIEFQVIYLALFFRLSVRHSFSWFWMESL